MTKSSIPSDADLSGLVRDSPALSIEWARTPTWRIVLWPMLLGATSTLAAMVLTKWLVDIGLL